MPSFAIRPATLDDLDTIVDFNVRLADETEDTQLARDVVRRGVQALLIDDARGRYHVAHDGDEVIGQIMHTREWSDWRDGDIWWIQSVYVRADRRRHGVFRALYAHLKAEAATHPRVVGLRLYVERENAAARATYAGLGMTEPSYLVMQDLFEPER